MTPPTLGREYYGHEAIDLLRRLEAALDGAYLGPLGLADGRRLIEILRRLRARVDVYGRMDRGG